MEKLLREIAKKFNSRRKSNVFRDVVRKLLSFPLM